MTKLDLSLRVIVPLLTIVLVSAAQSQHPVVPPGMVRHTHSGNLPPGTVAREQLKRDASFRGYFQPVKLYGPQRSSISVVVKGRFMKPQRSPITAGLLIGKVYRFRVSGIRGREGFEVFPTVEVVNRLYPPPGQSARFPIPIELTEEDLSLAIEGRFVTRVVYLENPQTALPVAQKTQDQRYFEVAPDQDPLQVADELGRPMAILRMGSRLPSAGESILSFSYGSPPLLVFPEELNPAAAELKQFYPAQATRNDAGNGGSNR